MLIKASFIESVKGLGDVNKCSDVLAELISINPHLALLQESKLQDISDQKLRSFLPRALDHSVSLPVVGSAGGTISAANSSYLNIVSYTNHSSTTLIIKTLALGHNIAVRDIFSYLYLIVYRICNSSYILSIGETSCPSSFVLNI